jgi:DNA-binding response OmpR family regulator
MGFEALSCYDGHSALLINDSFRPAICFVDLNMPGMDGTELAIRLTEASWRPLLLVAITAMSNETSCVRIKKAGFDIHLVKPVDPKQLVEIVNQLFRITSAGLANRKWQGRARRAVRG